MILDIIRGLDFRELFKLSGLLITRPLLIYPTYKATKETISICNQRFGSRHGKNNRANAFRHALWNYQICVESFKVLRSEEKSLNWCKKITDLHEELSPNKWLAREMDLHNNGIGRKLFRRNKSEFGIMIENIAKLSDQAKKISSVEEIKNYNEDLVFIKD